MKPLVAFIAALLIPAQIYAEGIPQENLLDKVVFQTEAKLWVQTETALLRVNINATLTNADLVKVRADLMSHLNQIAKGEWHLTQFDRSQDSSGLEKLFVHAELRLPQSSLTNVYSKAKAVSKPGSSYTIEGIDFTPGLEEVSAIRAKIRENLYQKINDELARLNKIYPEQHYSLNHVYITESDAQTPLRPLSSQKMKTEMMAALSTTPNLAVSNELILSAVVELASNRKAGSSVVAHQ